MTGTGRVLTLAQLRAADACFHQLARFERKFGESVVVTVELAVKHATDFDFGWAVKNLLSAPARTAYVADMAPTWAVYEAAKVTARAVCEVAVNPAQDAYEAVNAQAAAWDAYVAARATAWAAAYIADGGAA